MICVFADALIKMLFVSLTPTPSLFYRILDIYISRNMSVYACIAAVIVMCGSLSQSIKSAFERVIGTLSGGLAGIMFIFLRENLIPYDIIILPLGVIMLIYLLTLFEKGSLVTATLTVFLITMISGPSQTHIYVASKLLATVFGAAVSLFVNIVIKPKQEKLL